MRSSFEQIESELPNGFHDALLQRITLDLVSSTAKLDLQLLVGQPDAPTEEEREAYRGATLTLEDLVYFVIDPLAPNGEFSNPAGVIISGGDATNRRNPRSPAPRSALPEGGFAHWFFVDEWNSFIHVAAQRACLEWDEER
jgi:hypothetical protein